MRVHLGELIDCGGFCRVYVAHVLNSSLSTTTVALKKAHITKHVKNPMLRHEACALLMLKGHGSVPKVLAWGRTQYYEYLAMEMLGKPITSILKPPEKPTLHDLVVLLCQMLDAVEHVHSNNIVHGDIKPGNFLFGIDPPNDGRIYLIDYGLAKWYVDSATSEHIKKTSVPSLRGTYSYASLNAHHHCVSSRRDDMESLAYSMVRLLRGALPWHAIAPQEVYSVKQAWSGSALCAGYPPIFGSFLDYTRKLGFMEKPDYQRWKHEFCVAITGSPDDPIYSPYTRGGPYIGSSNLDSPPARSSTPRSEPPLSEGSVDSLPDSDDHWCPTITWPAPMGVRPEDLFGDEEGTVRNELEGFSEPPLRDEISLDSALRPEVMVK